MKLCLPRAVLALAHVLTTTSLCLGAPVLEATEPEEHEQHLLRAIDFSAHLPFPSLFENPPSSSNPDEGQSSVPSRYQSTLLARRLLHLSPHADLVTTFPSSENLTSRTPSSVQNTPIGLPEYIATCEDGAHSGDPTILSLKISTSTRNAQAGSNVSLSISWWDEYLHLQGPNLIPYSPANLPRLSLIGYLEEIPLATPSAQRALEACFLQKHKDSMMWLPGSKWAAHEGFWTRLVVQEAYWIGGFGDRNYIGWLDPEEWRSVKSKEWEAVRLPGEKD